MLRRTILITLAAFTLAACETVDGAGKDLEKAGEVVSKTAKKVQRSF